MENYAPKTNFGKTHLTGDAQKLGSDIKSEAGEFADRASDAAKAMGAHASEALDDLKSAGRGVVDDYATMAARGKRQIREAAGRVSEYADQNTALMVGGALVLGVLVGYVITRGGE